MIRTACPTESRIKRTKRRCKRSARKKIKTTSRNETTAEDKRHPSENIRENAANVDGVSPDSSFYVETNKQQEKTTNTNREEGEENQLGAAKRSLDRELM